MLAFLALAGVLTAGSSKPALAATCTTSSASGNCGPFSNPNVYTDVNGADLVAQDVWNTPPNWSEPANCASAPSCQALTGNGDNNWTVAANFGNPQDPGSVKSYPDTQVTYTLPNGTTPPMSNFGSSLVSSWGNIDPTGSNLDFEYAYDVWLNPAGAQSWGNPSDQEIMIWTDNHGQTPAGSPNGQVYTDAAGTRWTVWVDGGGSTVGADAIVSFVRESNAATGAVDLMGFFNWLKANGHTAANAGVDQLDYGVEICDTGGINKTFGLTNYTLVKNGSPAPAPSPTPTPTQTTPSPTPTPTGSTPPPPPPSVPPAPSVPVLLNNGNTRYFLWNVVNGADDYQLQILNSSGAVLHQGRTAGTWIKSYLTPASYRVRVRDEVNGVWSAWSAQKAFT